MAEVVLQRRHYKKAQYLWMFFRGVRAEFKMANGAVFGYKNLCAGHVRSCAFASLPVIHFPTVGRAILVP